MEKLGESLERTPKKREQWGSRFEFFLATLGYSVGMGSLTRFPYMAMRNGGGAFLIPFSIAMMLVGIPLFYMEVILGQFSGRSPLTMWEITPAFRGIGYSMTLLTLFSTSYYMPFTWSLVYLSESFKTDLPWKHCNNTWNTQKCMDDSIRLHLNSSDIPKTSSPAEEYWNEHILRISRDGFSHLSSINWNLVIAHFASFFIVFLCVIKGTASAGKVVYVTATLPYVLLTVLLVRGLTLEGSLKGIEYFLKPEWSRLADYNVWLEATIQVVFQLGPAWGSLITMSRFNDFHHKCFREAVVTPIGNLLTAVYGGAALFSILGYMSHKYNVPIEDAVNSGPALVFVVYPEALALLPMAPLWSCVFFVMLIMVAIDSQFAFFETIVSGLVDMFPKLERCKMLVSALLAIFLATLGLPLCSRSGMYIYQILDWYGAVLTFTMIAFLESIAVIYIYGVERFCSDATLMFGSPPNRLVRFVWVAVTPILLAVVAFVGLWNLQLPFYSYTNYKYPTLSIVFGWCFGITSFLPVPITMIYVFWRYRHNYIKCFQPTINWIPAKDDLVESYRIRWYYDQSEKVNGQLSRQTTSTNSVVELAPLV